MRKSSVSSVTYTVIWDKNIDILLLSDCKHSTLTTSQWAKNMSNFHILPATVFQC